LFNFDEETWLKEYIGVRFKKSVIVHFAPAKNEERANGPG